MLNKLTCCVTTVVALVSCNVIAQEVPAKTPPPNFVFFLVDDLGWKDVGCFGSSFYETPNIDALAASGMKFTSAYAACPVCSPTRASLMTGRHPVRVDITDCIPGATSARFENPRFDHVYDRDNLALGEVTIAEVLRNNGYATCFAGKWHLGGKGHLPTDQGFDINFGGHEKGSPPGGYYSPFKNPYLPNRADGEYLTERLTEECRGFLNTVDKPFLLYFSYYNVHTPIQAYKKRIEHFEAKAKRMFDHPRVPPIPEHKGKSRARQDLPALASMIAAVDDSVGEILGTLRERGFMDNTVVVFFSDNGGLCTLRNEGPTCNLPLRSGKGWLYEGGIREPMIVRAPNVTKAGSVTEAPAFSTDFFPTILELAGLPEQPELHADGESLVPLLRGESWHPKRPLCWHYPHYHGSTWTPGAAIRDGDWKLIEFYEYGETELYNLRNDLGEQNELSRQHPEKLRELQTKLKAWQTEMKARMPQPNPSYKP